MVTSNIEDILPCYRPFHQKSRIFPKYLLTEGVIFL